MVIDPFRSLSKSKGNTETQSSENATEESSTVKMNKILFEKLVDDQAVPLKLIRDTIVNLVSIALGGDTFAAEYVLLHMLSMVRGREPALAIGAFSLNIMRMKNYKYLQQVLELLLPRVAYIPLSIEHLNGRRFVPQKNYEMNRLVTGPLQLLEHTYIVCDETKMNAGKLNDTGCRNLQALQQLSNEATLKYDFQYHEMEFNMDTPY